MAASEGAAAALEHGAPHNGLAQGSFYCLARRLLGPGHGQKGAGSGRWWSGLAGHMELWRMLLARLIPRADGR